MDPRNILFIVVAVVAAVLAVVVVWRASAVWRERNRRQMRQLFHRRREWLEAEFLKVVSRSGKPRGLAWADCDFDDGVQFAKDRVTGQLCALVAVTVSFTAIEGGGMEDVEAVSNLRVATAVFLYDGKAWTTNGRALFNLDPSQAITRLGNELERVD